MKPVCHVCNGRHHNNNAIYVFAQAQIFESLHIQQGQRMNINSNISPLNLLVCTRCFISVLSVHHFDRQAEEKSAIINQYLSVDG